jgi:hypothetical protein
LHRASRLLLAVLAILLLAACTITSDHALTSNNEAAAPLPDAFTYFPYERSANGYVPQPGPPGEFVRQGAEYVSSDLRGLKGSLRVRFVRLNDDLFLLTATVSGSPAATYGFARYDDGVLSVALSPDAATATALRRARRRMMPQERLALNGLSIAGDTDAITVTTRAALDGLAHLYASGRLPLAPPSVGFVALDPTSAPPARLVPSGSDWIEVQ